MTIGVVVFSTLPLALTIAIGEQYICAMNVKRMATTIQHRELELWKHTGSVDQLES